MVELALDRGHIREDIGVVVFQVVEDRHQRPVMHELAALVEKRGVVLVGFHHEFAPLAQPRRHAEVCGHATDQKPRRTTGSLQQVAQDGGGGGLAVSAGDRQRVAARQHLLGQPLRAEV